MIKFSTVHPSVGIGLQEQGGPNTTVAVAVLVVVTLAVVAGIISVCASFRWLWHLE